MKLLPSAGGHRRSPLGLRRAPAGKLGISAEGGTGATRGTGRKCPTDHGRGAVLVLPPAGERRHAAGRRHRGARGSFTGRKGTGGCRARKWGKRTWR